MLVVALDVGTSSARARVFDAMGRAQAGAEGHVAYEPTTSADGGVELDPGDLMEAVASALDRCLAGAGARAGDVAAVGVSVFWHSLLRSEEHTSELQSLAYLVCRLLLEKKK